MLQDLRIILFENSKLNRISWSWDENNSDKQMAFKALLEVLIIFGALMIIIIGKENTRIRKNKIAREGWQTMGGGRTYLYSLVQINYISLNQCFFIYLIYCLTNKLISYSLEECSSKLASSSFTFLLWKRMLSRIFFVSLLLLSLSFLHWLHLQKVFSSHFHVD